MEAEVTHVEILGRRHAVTLPDFAEREELVSAYGGAIQDGGSRLLRACSAALGLCTRIGRHAKADYAAHDFRALGYGGAVYGYLREQGATPKQVVKAAEPLWSVLIASLPPTEPEVQEREVFSAAAAPET